MIVDDKPQEIDMGLHVDDRGEISYCNEIDLSRYVRLYKVSNNDLVNTRCYHGHMIESKGVLPCSGDSLLVVAKLKMDSSGMVVIDNDYEPIRYVLSVKTPKFIHIPPGYANGFMSLTRDASLMFFSSLGVSESSADDYRFSIGAITPSPFEIEVR